MEKFKSRKFWTAIVGSLIPIAAQVATGEVGWQAAVGMSVTILLGYIFGQGYVDGRAKENGNK